MTRAAPKNAGRGRILLARLWEPARFTRVCAATALGWLTLVAGGSLIVRPKIEDFGQYYMAGALVLEGEFDSLYPVPVPDAGVNAGWEEGSSLPPRYAALAEARGVGDAPRFIQPPPAALLFSPLGLLSYQSAFVFWVGLMIACTWGTAMLAGRFYDVIVGEPTRTAGLVILLVAMSPLAARTIRGSNITPLIALTGAIVLLDLVRGGSVRGGLGLAVGVLFKYMPASLLLLPLVLRRWGLVAWAAASGGAIVITALLVMRLGPFEWFLYEIAPTLRYGSNYPGNQSLGGLIQRMTGAELLGSGWMTGVRVVGLVVLAMFVALLVKNRASLRFPPVLLAAGAGLTAWWAISGPLFWEHYYLALCPFWSWLIWEARCGGWRGLAAISAIVLTWVPVNFLVPGMAEPFGSLMFAGALLVFILALARLRDPSKAPPGWVLPADPRVVADIASG